MRLRRLPFIAALILLSGTNASAQAQRMALAIGEYIANAASDAFMRAFCIDLERAAPTTNTVFTNGFGSADSVRIEYNGHTYTPRQAMDQGIGEFLGSDMTGVRFHPKVPGEVRIKVTDPFVLGDRNDPPSKEDLNVVRSLVKSAPAPNAIPAKQPAEQPGKQTTATRPLLGADDDGLQFRLWDELENARERAEVRDRQVLLADLGYNVGAPDGIEGPRYEAALREAEKAAPDEPWEEAPTSAIADTVVLTKRQLSPQSGEIVARLMSKRLAGVGFDGESAMAQFAAYHGLPESATRTSAFLDQLKADEDTARSLASIFSPAIASEESRTGTAYLLKGDVPETWVVSHGAVTRALGKDAIKLLDTQAIGTARSASSGNSVFVYPSRYPAAGGRLSIQIGNTAIAPTAAEMEAFLSGGADLPGLDAAIQANKHAAGERQAIFIYRGALERSRPEIQEAGFGDLEDATAAVDTTLLAVRLRQRLSETADVYLASDVDTALDNADFQPMVAKASDIAVFKGEKIQDWGALDDLTKALADANIPVHADKLGTIKAGNVVILTGHRDSNLADYMDKLVDAGDLDDKLVVLFSCYGASCEIGQSRILNAGVDGPAGVVYFPDEINSTAVTMVLKELTVLVGKGPISPTKMTDLIDQSVTNALAKARPELKPEIEKLRRMIVQLSRLYGTGEPQDGDIA